MPSRPARFLAPLSRFVLEILPWALSGVIGLYLIWGLLTGIEPARAAPKPAPAASAASPIARTLARASS